MIKDNKKWDSCKLRFKNFLDFWILPLKYILIALLFIAIPFVLDALAGCELIKGLWHTNFDKNTWFTFWGSYLPGIAIGLITFYNSEQIIKQKKRIDEIQEKYRFSIKEAGLNEYNVESKSFGSYPLSDLLRSFEGIDEQGGVEYKDGYLLDFLIVDGKDLAIINGTAIEGVTWTITGKNYGKEYVVAKHSGKSSDKKHVYVYWLFKNDTELKQHISYCKAKTRNHGASILSSTIKLELKIILFDESVYDLLIEFEIRFDEEKKQLYVVGSRCITNKG